MTGTLHPVGIGILHYRDPDAVRTCLRHLDVPDGLPVLVWDNSARSAPVGSLGATEVLDSPTNVGYARAMNRLFVELASRGAERMLLLTQDARITYDDVRLLVETSRAERAALVGPLLIDADNDLVFSAGGVITSGCLAQVSHRARGRTPSEVNPGVADADWLDGAILVLDPKQVGPQPFDERFFLYYEDVDLGYRLRKAAKRVVVDLRVRAHQRPGNVRLYFTVKNRLYWLKKHGLWMAWVTTLGKALLRLLLAAASGRGAAARDIGRALVGAGPASPSDPARASE